MLCKTRGIVLHAIPYNDKYSIIYMYTEAFGRTSYSGGAQSWKEVACFQGAVYAPFGFRDGGGASE